MAKSKRKRGVNGSSKKSKTGDERGSNKLSIKILVDTKANKVLFAEANKDFVDFLCHIMSLPIGTIIKLLNVKGMVGCLGTLYRSIDSLSNDYFSEDLDKNAVLNAGLSPANVPLLRLTNTNAASSSSTSSSNSMKKFFLCNCCQSGGYVTDLKGASCPKCGSKMNVKLKYFRPTTGANDSTASSCNENGGYVKGLVTYMVMDDLEVKPLSTISGVTLFSKFRVTDISALEEKEIDVGFNEGLAMLKASLETNTVLTTVFLAKKK